MTYQVVIRREADRALQRLSRTETLRKLRCLGTTRMFPGWTSSGLLAARPFYCLRGGDWRVIFDRQDSVRIITLQKIKLRK